MQLGTIQGKVNTSDFDFRATEEVGKFDFVSVKSNEKWILAQIDEVTKHTDGETIAHANIIGYRDKGMTRAPRQVIEPDSIVYEADQELISDTLGLKSDGLKIGTLETNEGIDIHVDPEEFYKHFAVLAQTGAGKSYLTGVIIEELLEKDFPLIIVDPHGEYSSLEHPNPENKEKSRSYNVREFSPNTKINDQALPLRFSSVNMSKKELTTLIPDSLTNSQMGVLYNALKKLKENDKDYNLLDIEDAVSHEDSTAKWNLLNYLEQLEDANIFGEDSVNLKNFVKAGEATIVNLKAVEPDAAEMTVYMLAKKLFDMRKKGRIPPFLMIFEEAHNFIPEKGFGQAISNPIMRKIASEGRKFGLGIGVISQRPARIDKNVLSQCNTQFILKVTNPNDLKAISKSFEGITSEVESMIKSLPPGVCFALGNEYPVMTAVRTRKSKHGGETETAQSYTKKEEIKIFKTEKERSDLESRFEAKLKPIYHPLYEVETEDRIILIDGQQGELKAERKKPTGIQSKVYDLIREGKTKKDIMDELDMSLTRFSNIMDKLRKKELLKENEIKATESVLEIGYETIDTEEENLKEFKHTEDKVKQNYNVSSVKKVYYPYFTGDQVMYDPVLDTELS